MQWEKVLHEVRMFATTKPKIFCTLVGAVLVALVFYGYYEIHRPTPATQTMTVRGGDHDQNVNKNSGTINQSNH